MPDPIPNMNGVRNFSHPAAKTGLIEAIDSGNSDAVHSLLSIGGLPQSFIDVGFRRAVELPNAEVVRAFLESGKVIPNAFNGIIITLASHAGHIENVHALLADSRVDPSINDNRPLQVAIEAGHVDIVQALLSDPRVDPRVPEWRPFISILEAPSNRIEILKLFLADRRIDPTEGNNWMQKLLQVSLQTPGISSGRKDEIEAMIELLRTGSRSLRVAAMQKAGRRRTKRGTKITHRRGTRSVARAIPKTYRY